MKKILLKFGNLIYFLYLCIVEVWKSFLRKLNSDYQPSSSRDLIEVNY